MKANKLLDSVLNNLSIKNDAALSRKLEVGQPVLSLIRSGKPIGASLILKIHKVTGMSVGEIEKLSKSEDV